ncbi:MAG: dihydroorotate dehydrogenase [Dissulfurimicrobium sp.]|uniref:dihydroorotate dehydrogenase n=1 Tax=Dissulfurimicrobium TaxID=1769732 RepID=UPI001EDADEA1|nr:dihydroorotate dehydrogenase [Dissulfurimicrobium hydrothermale]UKL14302.1 dihydroorotate dehydrogenase [Dissulfurimicrobium hydrothermale]
MKKTTRVKMPQDQDISPDMSVDVGGLKLKNPVLLASGTCGYGVEIGDLIDLSALGGIVVKGLSLKPRQGNPPPRIAETPCGLLNSIGLENIGIEAFIRDKLPWLRKINTRVIVNILGNSQEEYASLARRIDGTDGIDAIEVNISCPNVLAGGLAIGADPNAAAGVTRAVKAATGLPVIVKLSPNVTDIVEIARAVTAAGADAISLINTPLGMAIDIDKRRPALGNVVGGLSGPAIKPIALRMVWQVAGAIDVPIIGIGGISSASDALEFLMAGASAIEVGTATLVKPSVAIDIIAGVRDYMKKNNFLRIDDLPIPRD